MSEKQVNRLSTLFLVSGLGALWLTLCFYYVVGKDGGDVFSSPETTGMFVYYLFNSIALSYSAFELKKFKLNSFVFLSMVLFISVTVSLLIPLGESNLFFVTAYTGAVAGFMFGGTILVPFFLISIYLSAYKALLILTKKISLQKSNHQDENIVSTKNLDQLPPTN